MIWPFDDLKLDKKFPCDYWCYVLLPTPPYSDPIYFVFQHQIIMFSLLVGLITFGAQIYMTHKPACTGLSSYAGLTFYSLCLIEILRVLGSQCFLLFFVLIDINILQQW